MNIINEDIIALCKAKKINGDKMIYESISDIINKRHGTSFSPESIRTISRRYRASKGLDENFNEIKCEKTFSIGNSTCDKSTVCINPDSTTTSEMNICIDKNERLDSDTLLEKHGYDKDEFILVSAKNSKWTMDGEKELYSSKITVKPKSEFKWTQKTIDKILDGIKINPCIEEYSQTKHKNNGLALILPIVDLHYSMSASIESSGNHYDSNEAKNIFFEVINDVLSRTVHMDFEKIFFTIGNDILNCDNKSGTTTKGTPQVNDGEIEKAIVEVTDMLIEAIDILKKISNVEVVHIPGNHDYITSFGIVNALRARYSLDDRVSIDCGFSERKYKVFGKTLLGFSHNIKTEKVNDIIQSDARGMLADTNNTVYLLAHLHHEDCVDVNGTDVRRLPTISAKSRWTYENGYNAVRKNQSFILDGEYGITDVIYTILK